MAIVLTPRPLAGGAALALVRLWGAGLDVFFARHFSKPVVPGRCVHGQLSSGDRVIDDPVVVWSADGKWADISLHGGAWIVAEVLELAKGEGFKVIGDIGTQSGESDFNSIAFAECQSILEREMLAHLPLARTESGLRMLLAQPGNWRKALGGGVGGDFAKGDSGYMERAPTLTLPRSTRGGETGGGEAGGNRQDSHINRWAGVLGDRALWWLLHPPQIAIVGAANVGKSTLANQLFGQERSITADLPGTTRDWVGAISNVNGLAVELVDTPGNRQTADSIELAAIARSGEKIRQSDLVIRILDATLPTDTGSSGMSAQNEMTVINKIDLATGANISVKDAIRMSARTGDGVPELRRRIREYFGVDSSDDRRPRWWTSRQLEILLRAQIDPNAIQEMDR
jgi:small GTP-binding protein